MHDVGKTAIPDAILNKPGPLTEAEWEFMRTHTVVGERILLADPALAPIAPIARSHHERWDGAGYPDGLEGRTSRRRRGSSPSATPTRRWSPTVPIAPGGRAAEALAELSAARARTSTPPWSTAFVAMMADE